LNRNEISLYHNNTSSTSNFTVENPCIENIIYQENYVKKGCPVMDFMEFMNPLRYFPHEGYQFFWRTLFATILQGFWARFFATSFLFLAFWFGVRKQRLQLGIA